MFTIRKWRLTYLFYNSLLTLISSSSRQGFSQSLFYMLLSSPSFSRKFHFPGWIESFLQTYCCKLDSSRFVTLCLLCHKGLLICKSYRKCIWLTAPLPLVGLAGALGAVLWTSRKSPLLPVNKWHGSVLCNFLLGRCRIFCDLSFMLYFNRLLINGVNLKLPVLWLCFIPLPHHVVQN